LDFAQLRRLSRLTLSQQIRWGPVSASPKLPKLRVRSRKSARSRRPGRRTPTPERGDPEGNLAGNGVVRGAACEWECGSHPSPLAHGKCTSVGALHERSTGSTAMKYDRGSSTCPCIMRLAWRLVGAAARTPHEHASPRWHRRRCVEADAARPRRSCQTAAHLAY